MASRLFRLRALPTRRRCTLAVTLREADREKIASVFVFAVGLDHPLAPLVKPRAANQEGDAGDPLPRVLTQMLCVIAPCETDARPRRRGHDVGKLGTCPLAMVAAGGGA